MTMKLDSHVHTRYSGMTTIWPLHRVLRESYNTPERVYRLAKARGMDLVAITDHDTIDGALTLAHLEDVIAGCEVTATIPALVRTRYGICELDGPCSAPVPARPRLLPGIHAFKPIASVFFLL